MTGMAEEGCIRAGCGGGEGGTGRRPAHERVSSGHRRPVHCAPTRGCAGSTRRRMLIRVQRLIFHLQ